MQAFLAKEREIVDGEFDQDLIKEIPGAGVLGEILGMTKERVYSARRVVEIEAAGFEVASGLLDCFLEAVNDVARHGDGASPRSRTLLKLMPDHVQWSAREWKDEAYGQLQVVTDFFCGMTDSFAVSLYQKVMRPRRASPSAFFHENRTTRTFQSASEPLPAGSGRLRQRPAAARHRVEEAPRVRARVVRQEPDALQTANPRAVPVQRAAHRLERHGQSRRLDPLFKAQVQPLVKHGADLR